MKSKLRPTLRQVLAFSFAGLLAGLGLLFYLVLNGSERTILRSADRYRDLASREVAGRVIAYLNEAPKAISHFERQVTYGLVQPKNPESVEPELLSLLLSNENISEATLTYADDANGNVMANRANTGQVAVLRSSVPGGFICRRTRFDHGRFASQLSTFGVGAPAAGSPASPLVPANDPSMHPTFETPVSQDLYGTLVWADLHWAQIDEDMPTGQRRVEVSVQKSVENADGKFVGVLRIGLMKSLIDGAVRQKLTEGSARDPHMIFLCDNDGRLITGFGDKLNVIEAGDDLRIAPQDVPPVVARALREPTLSGITDASASANSSFEFEGRDYLYTFQALPESQNWIIGIVVPRDYYLSSLLAIRNEVTEVLVILIAAIVVAGALILRNVMSSQTLISNETAKMKRFEFTPTQASPWLRDIGEVLDGLEKAKTAMRAMSKYVPVNLVRRLYRDGEEPVLGGKSAELTILFSDIKGFTPYSEQVSPDRVAEVLGLYLQAVTAAIQDEDGTIDKYVGDSVMALWNVPEETPEHEIRACRAALRCREVLRQLYESPQWGDAPHFETRFGLHRCVASVGHFGAPDRFSYTTIGDGVNLASRIEGLNKFYETTIIVSEAVWEKAQDRFHFRRLDCVAVSGTRKGVVIYELISVRAGGVEQGADRSKSVAAYEEAFALYQQGDFQMALNILEKGNLLANGNAESDAPANRSGDGPSRTLAARCRRFLAEPPEQWNGVWAVDTK